MSEEKAETPTQQLLSKIGLEHPNEKLAEKLAKDWQWFNMAATSYSDTGTEKLRSTVRSIREVGEDVVQQQQARSRPPLGLAPRAAHTGTRSRAGR